MGEEKGKYPPFPDMTDPPPISVADAIKAGRMLRAHEKALRHDAPVHPLPKPARPKFPKVTDVKTSSRAARAHSRCLRKHGAVLTDRLEHMAKPPRRTIIYLWRDHADTLAPETIDRLRTMLDADEPFKPDKAYEYFINMRKARKAGVGANKKSRLKQLKKEIDSISAYKKYVWSRNATVAFARGVQERLKKPGRYALADGMLRLSNIILNELCGCMSMRTPCRCSKVPKAKFMMEMADKVAVWIDEVLCESDDRMLMMDFDEDDDIFFTDDFLDLMGTGRPGGGGGGGGAGGPPAYLKFTGEMLQAFTVLTDSMEARGEDELLFYGKFKQNYGQAANELKSAPNFDTEDYNCTIATKLKNDLLETVTPTTNAALMPFMKDMVDICSNYLAQLAENNKEKGPAFKALIKELKAKGKDELFEKDKCKKTNAQAAKDLEAAKGLDSEYDDAALTEVINTKLKALMEGVTTPELQEEMPETLDIVSKYLSQKAIEENERGPAFDLLVQQLEYHGAHRFLDGFPPLSNQFAVAYTLRTAPGFESVEPDCEAVAEIAELLELAVGPHTPNSMQEEMQEVIKRCAAYLSGFKRDREKAMQLVVTGMKGGGDEIFSSRNNYTMTFATAVEETESSPLIVPYHPVKDITQENKEKLKTRVESIPPELKTAVNTAMSDVAKHLSQPIALRSGAAGERYGNDLVGKMMKSMGDRPLYKYKSYGQSYADGAEELKHMSKVGAAGDSSSNPEMEALQAALTGELSTSVPTRMAPPVIASMQGNIDDAVKLLGKVGYEKGEAVHHLVGLLGEKKDEHLATLQGYDQTHGDAARRIQDASSLQADKVDKPSYGTVQTKLTKLVDDAAPHATLGHRMPGMIDEASKFLAGPIPETEAERRKVLADLMARKGKEELAREGIYKMDYLSGGQELSKAPVGIHTSVDRDKKAQIEQNVRGVIPNDELLKEMGDTASVGAAHLTNVVKGRGEAIKFIENQVRKDGNLDFLTIGKFSKTHEEAADMIAKADTLETEGMPNAKILEIVQRTLGKSLGNLQPPDAAKKYLPGTRELVGKYISKVAENQCGLDPKAINAWHALALSETSGGRRNRQIGGPETAQMAIQAAPEGDPHRDELLDILHKTLQQRGGDVLYKQPRIELTNMLASDWIKMSPPMYVNKSVKGCSDTARLHKKLEKKLGEVLDKATPNEMKDAMQDIIIECSRILAENLVSANYKALVKEAMIAELQKRGNTVIISKNGQTENAFFAAQRLKLADSLDPVLPVDPGISSTLAKNLEDAIRYQTVARKLTGTMKDHIKSVADYLSPFVTEPDAPIEAYVALLEVMEAIDKELLIEGPISKTYKAAAAYLRSLVSNVDQINIPNATLTSSIESKLKAAMANSGRDKDHSAGVLNNVIHNCAQLLSSYTMLQEEKTEALKFLVQQMLDKKEALLLRHGDIRKSNCEGAELLKGKNTDQLAVAHVDPVVVRKIQIKLHNLMPEVIPDKFARVMEDVIVDATKYLAFHLLQPLVVQVCKCMKNVFVQCELWCEEILRRVPEPCCTCSRHVSASALADLVPYERVVAAASGPSATAGPVIDIDIKPCPAMSRTRHDPGGPCTGSKPSSGCGTTSYMLYSTEYNRQRTYVEGPTRLPRSDAESLNSDSPLRGMSSGCSFGSVYQSDDQFNLNTSGTSPSLSLSLSPSLSLSLSPSPSQSQSQNQSPSPSDLRRGTSSGASDTTYHTSTSVILGENESTASSLSPPSTTHSPVRSVCKHFSPTTTEAGIGIPTHTIGTEAYSNRAPIVTTDKMGDWHAMMVSLTWNVQAWRNWIQQTIDSALISRSTSGEVSTWILAEVDENWSVFRRRIETESLQWRQYNLFSRTLALRLTLRYRDKQIVSPTRARVKTGVYMECQKEMLDIITMFNRWTHWLSVILAESDAMEPRIVDEPYRDTRWVFFKNKVEEYVDDWRKYNMHLKVCWERQYMSVMKDWFPSWSQPGPVWVMSAGGAVPSGAVAAGVADAEPTWVARATHRSRVLPAALRPSKHCCVLYADGAVQYYNKYQVLCNANVLWVAWRASEVSAGAVRVAPAVYVGRVLYHGAHLIGAVREPNFRCHVVIFGRPFAFNCYELLVLANKGELC